MKNRKKMKRFIIIFFLLISGGNIITKAQGSLYVNMNSINQKQYEMTIIKSLTFRDHKLQINKINDSFDTVSFSNFRFLNFININTLGFASEKTFNNIDIQLFPNPLLSNGILNYRFQTTQAGNVSIEILDLNGCFLWQQTNLSQVGINEFRVQNQRFPAGTYVCRITIGNRTKTVPLIINN